MLRTFVALLWLYSGNALACDAGALAASLDAAEAAFGAADARSLSDALAQVKRELACAREAVSPEACARVHRARALLAWTEQDPIGAKGSLRAMLHAEPFLALPPSLVPADHPLRGQLIQAEEALPLWTEAPGKGFVLVDGVRTGAIPVGQPYVLQKLGGDGSPRKAKLVEPTEAATRRNGGSSAQHGMRGAGAALAVIGGGLYGGAWASNAAYHRAVDEGDDPRIQSLHGATNALSIGSAGALLGGAGLLVGSLLVD